MVLQALVKTVYRMKSMPCHRNRPALLLEPNTINSTTQLMKEKSEFRPLWTSSSMAEQGNKATSPPQELPIGTFTKTFPPQELPTGTFTKTLPPQELCPKFGSCVDFSPSRKVTVWVIVLFKGSGTLGWGCSAEQ